MRILPFLLLSLLSATNALATGYGLGFFTRDERLRDATTGALKGWFTPEHPEVIEDLRVVLGIAFV